jgi:hypothetical protein
MKAKWGLAFSEVDAGFNLVVQDLKKLQNSTKQAQAALGMPIQIEGRTPPSVWVGLASLTGKFQDHQQKFVLAVSSLKEEKLDFRLHTNTKLENIECCLLAFESCFTKILPILRSILCTPESFASVLHCLQVLEAQVYLILELILSPLHPCQPRF